MGRPGVAVDTARAAVPRGSSQTRQAAGAAGPGDAARAGRHGVAAYEFAESTAGATVL